MRISASQLVKLALFLAVAGWLLPAGAAEAKPDKKKSLAALERGKKADGAGQRNEAIAAYSEAIQADGSNVEAWRARGRDYLARGYFFAAIGEAERAIHDYSLAINLNLERTEVYTARGKAYTEVRQFEKAEEDFTKRSEEHTSELQS